MSSVNKSPDFWWVHFHPISHFCSVVNHGKTKFVTLDYIVKKFSLFYDSPLIRESVTPALISWNIPKGKFPKGSYKNILWRKKNRDICIWSKIFQFSRMDPNGIYDITSSIFSPRFLRHEDAIGTKKKSLFCECQADKLHFFLKLLPFQ